MLKFKKCWDREELKYVSILTPYRRLQQSLYFVVRDCPLQIHPQLHSQRSSILQSICDNHIVKVPAQISEIVSSPAPTVIQ